MNYDKGLFSPELSIRVNAALNMVLSGYGASYVPDHCGFLVSKSELNGMTELNLLAADSYPSVIVSEELGVPVTVFDIRHYSGCKLEFLVPDVSDAICIQWVFQGKGLHLAFCISHKLSPDLLFKGRWQYPKNIKNWPKLNHKKIVQYWDRVNSTPFRVEFFNYVA